MKARNDKEGIRDQERARTKYEEDYRNTNNVVYGDEKCVVEMFIYLVLTIFL